MAKFGCQDVVGKCLGLGIAGVTFGLRNSSFHFQDNKKPWECKNCGATNTKEKCDYCDSHNVEKEEIKPIDN